MNRWKFFRRAIFMAFTVIFLLSAVVGATVKLYTASGEGYCYESESQDIAKQRAVDKAVKKATKEAGVYLKNYSRSVNSELTDDEVTAITSNAWQLVGEPKFTREIINHSGDTQIIVWTATVEVNVDDSEIQSWIKRDDKDKLQIISQTRGAQKSAEENERKIEDLREKYNRATSQAEKDSIRKQMTDADRDFLANQKLEEGLKLYYAKDYHGSIKLNTEAIELKPDWSWPYNNRGLAYADLGQKERAIQEFNKAIEMNPRLSQAYYNRGFAYYLLKQYERAILDFNKAIELNPKYAMAYNNRGLAYNQLKQYKKAVQDFSSAIQICTNLTQYKQSIQSTNYSAERINYQMLYARRGGAYYNLGQYEQAVQDYSKAIEIDPNWIMHYRRRAEAYKALKRYDKAIQDYNKVIQRLILPEFYYSRGECYQALGETEKAQADFAKAKELGYNG